MTGSRPMRTLAGYLIPFLRKSALLNTDIELHYKPDWPKKDLQQSCYGS